MSAQSDNANRRQLFIDEIVDLMFRYHKDTEWLLSEVDQSESKPLPKVTPLGILHSCQEHLLLRLLNSLKEMDQSLTRIGGEALPESRTYHWFFTDIVQSSDPILPSEDQAYKIITLNELIKRTESLQRADRATTFILPTGDGMAIGFIDSPEKPLKLAIELHKDITMFNDQVTDTKKKIQVRIGLHSGPVYIFKDPNNRENVWGDGIIKARRVMDVAAPMNILASKEFADQVKALTGRYKKMIHDLPEYPTKYGAISICNIYGHSFGNKQSPPKQMPVTAPRFIFDNILLELNITDKESMMTHHTMIWDLISSQDSAVDMVSVTLNGDVKKNHLEEINLLMTDEKNRTLTIDRILENNEYTKQFWVKLAEPIQPHQQGRRVKIEWDWEETRRNYIQEFVSYCKHFEFKLILPKELRNLRYKAAIIDRLGWMWKFDNPPISNYDGNTITIIWKIPDEIPANTRYRFDW